jgi:predicted regulator of Ras-like GTPase activity (Roadblock/LC7/MglB family)
MQAGENIYLPFTDILARLPASLAPFVLSPATGAFLLPVKTAVAQLPSGAVRIRFGELRKTAPTGTFTDDAGLDETLVDLPLPKILTAINPAVLARRSDQAQMDIAPEISGIFSSKIRADVPTSVAPAPAPIPVAAVPQAPAADTVTVRLSAVYEFWPDSVRQDITQFNLKDASVSMPMSRVEAALKTGRVAFTWGELINWLDVPAAPVATANQAVSVELPLKVIAPLFISQRRAPVVQKNITVADNVPSLFSGMGKPVASVAPVPAPVVPVVAPFSADAEPAKKDWSPQEITQKVNALPGVAASLIAMSDGFLVAGALPPPLKSETMAAFLPQIFGRLSNYSGEIQLGSLTAVTLLAGTCPCTIFKAGALYLAVLGKPGEALPDAVLQRMAGELAQRNQ